MARLDGKTALVTGGGRGIGAAIARKLASEGADVVLSYGGSKEAADAVADDIRAMGRRSEAVHCDAAETGATDRLVRDTAERLGGLDILVNNAGVYPLTTIRKCSDEEWERTMAINLRAPFEAGAEVLLVAAQWPAPRARHWLTGSNATGPLGFSSPKPTPSPPTATSCWAEWPRANARTSGSTCPPATSAAPGSPP